MSNIKSTEEFSRVENGKMLYFDRGGHHIYKGKNDLYTSMPKLMKDWNWENKRKPWEYTVNSHEKVNWICSVCKHTWDATIDSRSRGNGCSVCFKKASKPELMIKSYLDDNKVECKEQVRYGKYRADFIVKSTCLIEYNGYAFHKELINKDKLDIIIESGIKEVIIISEIRAESKENKIECIDTKLGDTKIKEIRYETYKYSYLDNFDKLLNILDYTLNSIGIDTIGKININEYKEYAVKNKGLLKENLTNQFSESIMKEYCIELNPNPETISSGSTLELNWKCSKCNYIYKCTPLNKKRGDMCPACSGHIVVKGINDLNTMNRSVANEILDESNKYLGYKSFQKVKWICSKCNNVWESRIYDRTVLDASCKVCGYTLLDKDRTLEYNFNDISVKYEIEYFKYEDKIIEYITNEKELLKLIIDKLCNSHKELLVELKLIIVDELFNIYKIEKSALVSRIKAKQKINVILNKIGVDVDKIKIKPLEV